MAKRYNKRNGKTSKRRIKSSKRRIKSSKRRIKSSKRRKVLKGGAHRIIPGPGALFDGVESAIDALKLRLDRRELTPEQFEAAVSKVMRPELYATDTTDTTDTTGYAAAALPGDASRALFDGVESAIDALKLQMERGKLTQEQFEAAVSRIMRPKLPLLPR